MWLMIDAKDLKVIVFFLWLCLVSFDGEVSRVMDKFTNEYDCEDSVMDGKE